MQKNYKGIIFVSTPDGNSGKSLKIGCLNGNTKEYKKFSENPAKNNCKDST